MQGNGNLVGMGRRMREVLGGLHLGQPFVGSYWETPLKVFYQVKLFMCIIGGEV